MKRNELLFQTHIIDSYAKAGGFGKKWATQMTVGVQDLVVCLPGHGVHLVEVKHRPEWAMGRDYGTPLEPKQLDIARRFIKAGGVSVLAVVFQSDKAIRSRLAYVDPLQSRTTLENSVEYVPGKGFDVAALMEKFIGKDKK